MSEQFNKNEKAIIPIAAFTASGDIENLRESLVNGLNTGLAVNEIKEVLVQMYAYCGFPRSLNALGTFMAVVEERKSNGIIDLQGPTSKSKPVIEQSLQIGTENQTKLVGQPVAGALFDFAPAIDEYLKAHLFGDIFEGNVLSWKHRELATIAALSNMQGVNSQLQAHYFISMNNGITPDLLAEFIRVLREQCGEEVAANADEVLANVLKSIEK